MATVCRQRRRTYADAELAASYKQQKKTIDEFHKAFIDRALSGASLKGLAGFYDLYTASDEKTSDSYAKKLNAAKAALRKEIAACFKAQDDFKTLNKKELIQQQLPQWLNTTASDLYNDEKFKGLNS